MPPLDPAIAVSHLWPEIIILLAGIVVIVLGIAPPGVRRLIPWVTAAAIAGSLAAITFLPVQHGADGAVAIGGGLVNTAFSAFIRKIVLTVAFVLLLINWSQPQREERGEFFGMMLFSIAGLMLTPMADDLLVLFIALELVSIPAYVMVALSRTHPASLEAGTKYFYLGAMAAAITGYGFSFLYGVSGTASLSQAIDYGTVAAALGSPGDAAYAFATIGFVVALAGVLFKIAAVPLHFYVADVYQGAAGPVAGFLGFVPKLAGLIAIVRLMELVHWSLTPALFWTLWIVAALTMTVGNLLALWQSNIKRMLGYSSIAHSGYMLVAILAGPAIGGAGEPAWLSGGLGDGIAAMLFYVVVYALTNAGAFAILSLLRVNGRPCETMRDVAGLVRRHPGLALLMALAMFIFIGLPPTPGFWGKLGIFGSALSAAERHAAVPGAGTWMIVLVVVGVLNSAVSAAYYLRVAAACLLYENERPADAAPREALQVGALLCGFLLLIFMFAPGLLWRHTRSAVTPQAGQIQLLGEDLMSPGDMSRIPLDRHAAGRATPRPPHDRGSP